MLHSSRMTQHCTKCTVRRDVIVPLGGSFMLINAELTETMAVTGTKHTRKIHDVTKLYFTLHCIMLQTYMTLHYFILDYKKVTCHIINKHAAQAAGADPSRCNSTNG